MNLREVKNCSILKKVEFDNQLFLLRVEKYFDFLPGQHISLGVPGTHFAREYSIASGISDNYLEVIFRKISNGKISNYLAERKEGDTLLVGSPIGHFGVDIGDNSILIATGSGIAPFLSFAKSYPYGFTILHGIRSSEDSFKDNFSEKDNYITCTSKDDSGKFPGKVTDYLQRISLDINKKYYLCGNGLMIQDAYKILKKIGISSQSIYYEEYF